MAASWAGVGPPREARAVARQGREALVSTLAANETASAKLAPSNTREAELQNRSTRTIGRRVHARHSNDQNVKLHRAEKFEPKRWNGALYWRAVHRTRRRGFPRGESAALPLGGP